MRNKLELIADSISEAYNCKILCIDNYKYIIDTDKNCHGPFSGILMRLEGKILIGEYNNNEIYHLILKGKYGGKFDNSTIDAMMVKVVEELEEDIDNRHRKKYIDSTSIEIELREVEYPEWNRHIHAIMYIGWRDTSQVENQTLEGLYDTKLRKWAAEPGKHSIHYKDNREYIEIVGDNYKQCIGKDYKSLVAGEYNHVTVLGENIYFVGDGVREHGGKVIYSDKITDTIIYEIDTLSRIEVGRYALLSDGKREVSLIESKTNAVISRISLSSRLYFEEKYIIVDDNIIEITEKVMSIHSNDEIQTDLEDIQIGVSWGSLKSISLAGRLYNAYELSPGIYYGISRQWEVLR